MFPIEYFSSVDLKLNIQIPKVHTIQCGYFVFLRSKNKIHEYFFYVQRRKKIFRLFILDFIFFIVVFIGTEE